jgi:hypothetical protein
MNDLELTSFKCKVMLDMLPINVTINATSSTAFVVLLSLLKEKIVCILYYHAVCVLCILYHQAVCVCILYHHAVCVFMLYHHAVCVFMLYHHSVCVCMSLHSNVSTNWLIFTVFGMGVIGLLNIVHFNCLQSLTQTRRMHKLVKWERH